MTHTIPQHRLSTALITTRQRPPRGRLRSNGVVFVVHELRSILNTAGLIAVLFARAEFLAAGNVG